MVQVPIKPGKTEVKLLSRGRAYTIPPILQDVPGGLYPMYSSSFVVDEYRLMGGWPVPVPEGDIRIDCLVSAEGNVLANRDAPTELTTAADMRWIADSNYFDVTSLRWTPIQSTVSPWETTVAHAPTLITDYEYRIGPERFTNMSALNFDSNTNDYMWNNLGLTMGGISGYTVIMVMSPNSVYGNDSTVYSNALWGPEAADGGWVMFTVRNKAVYLTTDNTLEQMGVAIGDALASPAPSYLALVVSKPLTTMYASSGGAQVLSKSLTAGAVAESLSTYFWLGNAPFSTTATMDMALLDLGIYGGLLTKSQVMSEFAKLSQVYGV